jgi:predicted RNase H-like HicB family nuclease
MELTAVIRREDDGYWAEVKELPGCFASGRSLDELREALAEAVELYLDDDPAANFTSLSVEEMKLVASA